MPQTGEVKEVHSNGLTLTLEWRIHGISHLMDGCYYSPSVECFNREWCLGIRKTGNGVDGVCLDRKLSTPGVPEPVHFSIQCKTSGGKEERGPFWEQKYPEPASWCSLSVDPPWTIPPSAGPTLTCCLGTGDSLHTTDFSNLQEHLKSLFFSGTGHDVVFKVGHKEFKAHKHILEVRSPVFSAMFHSDMAESAGGSITVEDCDPDSFGQFLQFVYCGKTDIDSVGSALSLYYAGDKYDFQSLKKMCVQFLKSSFTTTTVFEVISLAARYGEQELLQLAIVYFEDNYQQVWRTVEWQRFLLANPIEANEMNLKALQSKFSSHKK